MRNGLSIPYQEVRPKMAKTKKRWVKGFLLPESKVAVGLQLGRKMPDKEDFAQAIDRIKGRPGAYVGALYEHPRIAAGYLLVMPRVQAQKLVERFPQFEIFG
jgi:hypothetical protein